MRRRASVFAVTFLAAVSLLPARGLAQPASTVTPAPSPFELIHLEINLVPLAKAPEDPVTMLLSAIRSDGQGVAYRTHVDDKVAIVVNGETGDTYDAITQGPMFSQGEENHLAYVARQEDQTYVVVDEVKSSPYDAVLQDSLVFSPDGKRIAFAAGRLGQWRAIVAELAENRLDETQLGQFYSAISPEGIVFRPDGQALAFTAQQEAGWVLVTDGKQSRHYPWLGKLVFQPNGEKSIYVVRRNGQHYVIQKDNERQSVLGGPYEEVADVISSPDGRRTLYWAKRDGQWRVVAVPVDGRSRSTQNSFDGYGARSFAFSPDTTRLAFVGMREEKAIVVINGSEHGPYDAILEGSPVFSPDSKRFAYGVFQQGTWRILVDGTEAEAGYGMLKEHSLQFTPDSRHLVYVASYGNTGKSMAIAVDGELSNDYLFPLDSKIAFDDLQSLRTVAVVGKVLPSDDGKSARLDNGQFVRVQVRIRTESAEGR